MNDTTQASTTGSILAIIEMWIKPEDLETYSTYLKEILPGTKSFEGCQKIEIRTNPEDPTHILFQVNWSDVGQMMKYVAWRGETGVSAKLEAYFAKPMALSMWKTAEL
jgi:quinol monooxygenase YgiN